MFDGSSGSGYDIEAYRLGETLMELRDIVTGIHVNKELIYSSTLSGNIRVYVLKTNKYYAT